MTVRVEFTEFAEFELEFEFDFAPQAPPLQDLPLLIPIILSRLKQSF